jgi:hypothetical protein
MFPAGHSIMDIIIKQYMLGPRTRHTEGQNNLKIPITRTELRKQSFAVKAINQWNGLPESLKSCGSSEQFKRLIKNVPEQGGRP